MEDGRLPREGRGRADAGDALLHPVTLAALGLLALNDHVLKAAWPGLITGKLSDVAGLAFFPILLVGGAELVAASAGRWTGPTVRAVAVAVVLTAIGFTLTKMAPPAAEAVGWVLGVAQWMLALPGRALGGLAVLPAAPAMVVADPTDLVALPATLLAAWVGLSRVRFGRADRRAAAART